MTFEEWERYQDYMLKYYSGYFDDGLYEEKYEDYESDKDDESSDEDDAWDKNRRSCSCNDFCLSRATSPGWHLMNRTTIITIVFVCVIPPILMQELAVVII